MMPILRSKLEVDHHLLSTKDIDVQDQIQRELIARLLPDLSKLVDIHRVPCYSQGLVEFYAEVVAMTKDDFMANHAPNQSRRGIADGTMAVMHNGNWKIISNSSPYPAHVAPRPPPAPSKPKPFDPTEYLKNKVNELRS